MRIIVFLRILYEIVQGALQDDTADPRHEEAHTCNIFRAARTSLHLVGIEVVSQKEERRSPISDNVAEQEKQCAIGKVIIIARNEYIFPLAFLNRPMDVPFRTDILLVAVVAQIPVRFLHLLDKRLCVIRRDIIRNEDFRQLVVAKLLQNTS